MTAKEIVEKLTLEEKAELLAGSDFWHFKALERFGIPATLVTDGPHGIRKVKDIDSAMGAGEAVEATCFPPAVLSASSWDEDALYKEGEMIAEEALEEKIAVVLGPGANIKRSPLCGRNFEYFSEDPFLAGKMAAAWIKGVQSLGVGTSLKHFAANSQEKMRMISNSVVDERVLREIYLKQFEIAVKEAQCWTIMCSYNRINGTYSSDNKWLLDDVLRKDWGFKGIVITDWGAMNDRIEAVKAGLDIQMPGPDKANQEAVINAVKEGTLSQDDLDNAVLRIISLILKAEENKKDFKYNRSEHYSAAKEIASSSFILLKNEKKLLPLDKSKKYALLGSFAKHPRYQGSGSSQINSRYVSTLYDAMEKEGYDFTYEKGYETSGETDEETLKRAVNVAKTSDAVIILAGLTDESESEGFDRTSLSLPESQNRLINECLRVNENVIIVLYGGSPFTMPWIENASSLLLCYLAGDATGDATLSVLSGDINPSGRLAETFPLSLEDTPCYENYAHASKNVLYKESIFVGYRYYDYFEKEVLFPFGYGLSYTEFEYKDIKVEFDDSSKVGKAIVKIKNAGDRGGAEVVELYVEKLNSSILRPVRELKGFKKIYLEKGEEKDVEIPLSYDSFSYYSVPLGRFDIEDGIYRIHAASSSRSLKLYKDIYVSGNKSAKVMPWRYNDDFSLLFKERKLPLIEEGGKVDLNSTLTDLLKCEKVKEILSPLLNSYLEPLKGKEDALSRMAYQMIFEMPLRSLSSMSGALSREDIEKLMYLANSQRD